MRSVGLQGKIIVLLICLSIVPLTVAGHLLTAYSKDELTETTREGLTNLVEERAAYYGQTFYAFKEDARGVSTYVSSVWNASHPPQ
ncbi:MAG: hypothetical protein KGY55_04305, partial [Candidatus Thermoplasmatota archaeon]|nr:hypothetical protein [Candidatus Thermoplasmatota archaeon]